MDVMVLSNGYLVFWVDVGGVVKWLLGIQCGCYGVVKWLLGVLGGC